MDQQIETNNLCKENGLIERLKQLRNSVNLFFLNTRSNTTINDSQNNNLNDTANTNDTINTNDTTNINDSQNLRGKCNLFYDSLKKVCGKRSPYSLYGIEKQMKELVDPQIIEKNKEEIEFIIINPTRFTDYQVIVEELNVYKSNYDATVGTLFTSLSNYRESNNALDDLLDNLYMMCDSNDEYVKFLQHFNNIVSLHENFYRIDDYIIDDSSMQVDNVEKKKIVYVESPTSSTSSTGTSATSSIGTSATSSTGTSSTGFTAGGYLQKGGDMDLNDFCNGNYLDNNTDESNSLRNALGIAKTLDELKHDFDKLNKNGEKHIPSVMIETLSNVYSKFIEIMIDNIKTNNNSKNLNEIVTFIRDLKDFSIIDDQQEYLKDKEWNYYTSILKFMDNFCNKLGDLHITKLCKVTDLPFLNQVNKDYLKANGFIVEIDSSDNSEPSGKEEYLYLNIDNDIPQKIFMLMDIKYKFEDNPTSTRKLRPLIKDVDPEANLNTFVEDIVSVPSLLDPSTTSNKSTTIFSVETNDKIFDNIQNMQNINDACNNEVKQIVLKGLNDFCNYFGVNNEKIITDVSLIEMDGKYSGINLITQQSTFQLEIGDTTIENVSELVKSFNNLTITYLHDDNITPIPELNNVTQLNSAGKNKGESWKRLYNFGRFLLKNINEDTIKSLVEQLLQMNENPSFELVNLKQLIKNGQNKIVNSALSLVLTEIIVSLKSMGDSLQVNFTKRMYDYLKNNNILSKTYISSSDKNVGGESFLISNPFLINGTGIRPHLSFFKEYEKFFSQDCLRDFLTKSDKNIKTCNSKEYDKMTTITTNKSVATVLDAINSIKNSFNKIVPYMFYKPFVKIIDNDKNEEAIDQEATDEEGKNETSNESAEKESSAESEVSNEINFLTSDEISKIENPDENLLYLLESNEDNNKIFLEHIQIIKDLLERSNIYSEDGIKTLEDKTTTLISSLGEQNVNTEEIINSANSFDSFLKKTNSIIELATSPEEELLIPVDQSNVSTTNMDVEPDLKEQSNAPYTEDVQIIETNESNKKVKQFGIVKSITKILEAKMLSKYNCLAESNLLRVSQKIDSIDSNDINKYVQAQSINIYEPDSWASTNVNEYFVSNLKMCSEQYNNDLQNVVINIQDTLEALNYKDYNEIQGKITELTKKITELKTTNDPNNDSNNELTRLQKKRHIFKTYSENLKPIMKSSQRKTSTSETSEENETAKAEQDLLIESNYYIQLNTTKNELNKSIDGFTNSLYASGIAECIMAIREVEKSFQPKEGYKQEILKNLNIPIEPDVETKNKSKLMSFLKGTANILGLREKSKLSNQKKELDNLFKQFKVSQRNQKKNIQKVENINTSINNLIRKKMASNNKNSISNLTNKEERKETVVGLLKRNLNSILEKITNTLKTSPSTNSSSSSEKMSVIKTGGIIKNKNKKTKKRNTSKRPKKSNKKKKTNNKKTKRKKHKRKKQKTQKKK